MPLSAVASLRGMSLGYIRRRVAGKRDRECRERSILARFSCAGARHILGCKFFLSSMRGHCKKHFRLNITYRRRRQWYARQLLKKVARRLTFVAHREWTSTKNLRAPSSVAGVRCTAAASLVRATLSFIYVHAMRTSVLLSFSLKVAPAVKIHCFYHDCNETSTTIRYTM